MSKYYLIASTYDAKTKRFLNETAIENLPGIDLSTLPKIDYYTAMHNKSTILTTIEQITGQTNLNHIAIKYYKNKNSDPQYRRVIVSNREYADAIQKTFPIKYYLSGKIIEAHGVDRSSHLYQQELEKLMNIIKEKNIEKLNQTYPYDDLLKFLITNYINSPYEKISPMDLRQYEKEEHNRNLELIKLEFSRYKTFRGWIVAQEKAKQVTKQYTPPVQPSLSQTKKLDKLSPKTITECEEEYEKSHAITYQKNPNSTKEIAMTYNQYQTYEYNTSHEEKEEFLEENEMDMIWSPGVYDNFEEEYSHKRRR